MTRKTTGLLATAFVIGTALWFVNSSDTEFTRLTTGTTAERILAIPGDVVEVREGIILVNGNPLPGDTR
jgi:hypothetical protein